MNTALTILFLLLPAFPDFTGAWQAESPVSPIVSDPPDSTSRYMSDTELQKQVALLKTISDPVTRSRIVADIGNSYNKNVFTVLDAYLAEEEDPSVRADIISTLANLPVRKKQPENLPSIRIDWKSVDPAQYENSAKSACRKRWQQNGSFPEKNSLSIRKSGCPMNLPPCSRNISSCGMPIRQRV